MHFLINYLTFFSRCEIITIHIYALFIYLFYSLALSLFIFFRNHISIPDAFYCKSLRLLPPVFVALFKFYLCQRLPIFHIIYRCEFLWHIKFFHKNVIRHIIHCLHSLWDSKTCVLFTHWILKQCSHFLIV